MFTAGGMLVARGGVLRPSMSHRKAPPCPVLAVYLFRRSFSSFSLPSYHKKCCRGVLPRATGACPHRLAASSHLPALVPGARAVPDEFCCYRGRV